MKASTLSEPGAFRMTLAIVFAVAVSVVVGVAVAPGAGIALAIIALVIGVAFETHHLIA